MPIGHINEFDSANESWTQYAGRLACFLEANDIVEENKRKSTFLTVIGPATYGTLASLIMPDEITSKTYYQLLTIASAHFSPAPSVIVERVKFYNRFRLPGEPVATFISELKRLARNCNFETTLNEMLRDRLVCGINDDELQRRLLSEPADELNLEKVTKISLAYEAANKNVKDLQSLTISKGNSSVMQIRDSGPNSVPQKNKRNYKSFAANKRIYKPFAANKRNYTPFAVKKKLPEKSGNISFEYECIRCGSKMHKPADCYHINSKCRSCSKIGHLSRKCLSRSLELKSKVVNSVQALESAPVQVSTKEIESMEYSIFHLSTKDSDFAAALIRVFTLNGIGFPMQLDTGSHDSLMSEQSFQASGLIKTAKLEKSSAALKSFTGHDIHILGMFDVSVHYNGITEILPLHIFSGSGPSLCGRSWLFSKLQVFPSPVNCIASESSSVTLAHLLEKHKAVFNKELGLLSSAKVHLHKIPGVKPKFFKARTVPYALKEGVEKELSRLEQEGIIKPLQYSEWATPIVPVIKSDRKSIRICGDYKLTVNTATTTEQYPLPKVEDLFAQLAGGQKFTKLDLMDAYNQLSLDEESQKLVVINTQKGLFAYTRLPFGVASAPAIFQRTLENLLKGIPGTANFLDDILITGQTDAEHLANLESVLNRMNAAGLKLKKDKCLFFQDQVTYLGHVIDKEGLHPVQDKLEAIMQAPAPANVDQLRSYLGLLGYYGKFISDQSTLLAPLYRLLTKRQPWKWTEHENKAFKASKEALKNSSVLVHFDQDKELFLTCDASSYGIGAVLSHNINGMDRPIYFASRSLAPAEKNYSTIEREALAIMFGVSKFRDYLLGRMFTLITDHRPLVILFSEHKGMPSLASARIQRWALALSAYTYKIRYKHGCLNKNADALSRLPLPNFPSVIPVPKELVLLIRSLDDSPVTAYHMASATKKDPVLSQVLKFTESEWPNKFDESLAPFERRKSELSVQDGIVLWGNRVVVPYALQETVLTELHEGHFGMTIMKSLARSKVWWPKIDVQIEQLVGSCESCQQQLSLPPNTAYSPWPASTLPWSRLHIDYAGPVDNNKMLLIIVDSYTKWIEVFVLPTANSTNTVNSLQELFSRFGLPKTVVSDNGSCFAGKEFQDFMNESGIQQIFTAPYHPSSNGLAERAVRTIKTQLKKVSAFSLKGKLNKILLNYRRSPLASTGKSPAELMLGRQIRTKLDFLHPKEIVNPENQVVQKKCVNFRSKFVRGDKILARNYGVGPKWLPGTIVSNLGSVMFSCMTPKGLIRRHAHQLQHNRAPDSALLPVDMAATENSQQIEPIDIRQKFMADESPQSSFVEVPKPSSLAKETDPAIPNADLLNPCPQPASPEQTIARRCSTRLRRAPVRFVP